MTSDPRLAAAFRTWSSRFLGRSEVERATPQGLLVHRHALETFLVQNGLVSWKWAAVYLGVAMDRMKEIVDRLEGAGVSTQIGVGVSDQVVRQREAALLFRAFPSLRHRTFSDHSRMCRALHAAVRDELQIDVAPVLCVTSTTLDPEEPDIAAAFDAITLDPVGLRYQVWLDTNKPVNLQPDVCSLRFYAKNEEELRDRVMKGSEPEQIDRRLLAA
ncbi:MAG: hypothetical protein QM820_22170 [Minicystis sp.]